MDQLRVTRGSDYRSTLCMLDHREANAGIGRSSSGNMETEGAHGTGHLRCLSACTLRAEVLAFGDLFLFLFS